MTRHWARLERTMAIAIVELYLVVVAIGAVFGAGMGLVAYATMQIGRTVYRLARHEAALAWWAVANRRELARDSRVALEALDRRALRGLRGLASFYLGGR